MVTMDQLETKLGALIKEWDRKSAPVHQMGQLFTRSNREIYVQFYSELASAVVKKDFDNLKTASLILKQTRHNSAKVDFLQTVERLTRIIKHTPKNSPALRDALTYRAYILANNGCYEQAIIDNELKLKEMSKTNQQQIEEIAKLIEYYVELGYYKKVQDYLIEFKRVYDLQFKQSAKKLSGVKAEKLIKNDELKEKCQDFYKMIRYRIEQTEYKSIRHAEIVTSNYEPFRGFNRNPKIKYLSAACSLVNQHKRQMIVSNCAIPKGEILGVESPYLRQQVGMPSHCDSCYTMKKLFIPCFDCHFKSYCSYECRVKDKKWHQFECIGYKLLVIPTLKCEMLFRLLVQHLFLFKDVVFHREQVRQAKTAVELYNKIWEILPTMPSNLLNNESIGHNGFPEAEYKKAVLNSFRLTIFISEHTRILEDFCSNLSLDSYELEIFISSLLFILSGKFLTNMLEISTAFNASNSSSPNYTESKKFEYLNSSRQNMCNNLSIGESIFEFFGFSVDKMKAEASAAIQNAFEHFRLDEAEMNVPPFECDTGESSPLRDTDEIVATFMNFNSENNCPPSVIGLYLNIFKFSHSCDPNLRLIYLSSGRLLVKASRKIQTGEILTISYGCHYKQADNNTRLSSAKRFNISCLCDYCNGKFYPHFAENVMCRNCKSLVSPTEKVCVVCGYDMMKANNIYKHLIWDLEYNTAVSDDDRIIFYNLVFALLVYEEIMPSTHHVFIGKLLLLTDFLAKKNFLYETYVFLTKVSNILEKMYVEMSVELLYAYNMLLNPLIEILMNNISTSAIIPGILIDKMYVLGLKIVEEMVEINDFNVLYDEFTCEILNKYQLILNLKNRIYSSIVHVDVCNEILDSESAKSNEQNMDPLIRIEKRTYPSIKFKNENISNLIAVGSKDEMNVEYSANTQKLKEEKVSEKCLQSNQFNVSVSYDKKFNNDNFLNLNEHTKCMDKSEEEQFSKDCDLFFLELIEKRVESLKTALKV